MTRITSLLPIIEWTIRINIQQFTTSTIKSLLVHFISSHSIYVLVVHINM